MKYQDANTIHYDSKRFFVLAAVGLYFAGMCVVLHLSLLVVADRGVNEICLANLGKALCAHLTEDGERQ